MKLSQNSIGMGCWTKIERLWMSHLNSALKGESVDGAKLEQLLLGKPADDLRGLQGQAGAG